MINIEDSITRMSNNAEAIRSLVLGTTGAQACWKPEDAAWSMLEVINHLYDEEREDFRFRLDLIFHHPELNWRSNDPAVWVAERQYNHRDFEKSLDNFLKERTASINWLRGLSAPSWQNIYNHPSVGAISAEDMLTAWLAHDLLHTRQLLELQWAYLARQARPVALDYAGGW